MKTARAPNFTVTFAMLFACLIGASGCASAKNTAPTSSFLYEDRVVHPDLIALLLPAFGNEEPEAGAVDLDSVRSVAGIERHGTYVKAMSRDGDSAWNGYRYLGRTPRGLHVMVAEWNGGGTGIFETVIWGRIVRDPVSEDGKSRTRTMLVRTGYYSLGDRDDGEVRLEGDRLFIGPSKYRDHTTTITLN